MKSGKRRESPAENEFVALSALGAKKNVRPAELLSETLGRYAERTS